ncbi:MAG: glycoside hydrolase family 2 protein, partial [Erysipelotrichaceae bacterium]|nr:glycoside hydrolase family 2 protein [Erysipelotrichaceae bacterium]
FGSGDRVCYHGVMDMFRNPKLASAVYAMQGDKDSVLEVGTSMDIGDYPGGNVGSFYVFTNADSVKLYKNDVFVKEFKESEFKALKHGPLLIDDTIGKLLETNEGFTGDKEKLLHDCLLSAAKNGINDMPLKDKAKMGYAMMKYKLKYEDGVVLFGKYVGNWGGEATVWRFDGIKNDEVAVSRTLCPSSRLHLEVRQSATELHEGDMYDMAAVRVRVLDEYDNIAPYAQLPVRFAAEGDIEVVGPECATAEGGMTGTYIRTVGRSGAGKLTVSVSGLEDVVIEFTVKE